MNDNGTNVIISARNPSRDHSYAIVDCVFALFILFFHCSIRKIKTVKNYKNKNKSAS